MNICIFCSANEAAAEKYRNQALELGRWMASKGYNLLFGGCSMGLMRAMADAVTVSRAEAAGNGGGECASNIIGVVPKIIETGCKACVNMDEMVSCRNLSDRKDILVERSDAIIALPGGVGTLDEIFTVVASASIGYHDKTVILYNIDGFWNSTVAMLDDLQERGVIRGSWRRWIKVAETFGELAEAVDAGNTGNTGNE